MFRLQDEVVLTARHEHLRDLRADLRGDRALGDDPGRVGAPAAAVVVDEHGRHARLVAALLQRADGAGDADGGAPERVGVGEVPRAEHVDDDERGPARGGPFGKGSAFGGDGHEPS
jgi:hypothetical protein